ncbi:unnamed protein product [Moneuplotes crassus]|uniref:Uncharacterized protein n=1 Tax=Euplotes crassus TaxID=5936 RepID=A0AAD1U5S0_EUPCR|nr:unnamed protein product [Moneuplotes crassus]
MPVRNRPYAFFMPNYPMVNCMPYQFTSCFDKSPESSEVGSMLKYEFKAENEKCEKQKYNTKSIFKQQEELKVYYYDLGDQICQELTESHNEVLESISAKLKKAKWVQNNPNRSEDLYKASSEIDQPNPFHSKISAECKKLLVDIPGELEGPLKIKKTQISSLIKVDYEQKTTASEEVVGAPIFSGTLKPAEVPKTAEAPKPKMLTNEGSRASFIDTASDTDTTEIFEEEKLDVNSLFGFKALTSKKQIEAKASTDFTENSTKATCHRKRGRPRKDFAALPVKKMLAFLKAELLKKLKPLKESKRSDSVFIAIFRAIKKIPLWLLKKLKSKGRYKLDLRSQANCKLTIETYQEIYDYFIKILLELDITDRFQGRKDAFIHFCAIAFPAKRLLQLYQPDGTEDPDLAQKKEDLERLNKLLGQRNLNCYIKLRQFCKENPMMVSLIELFLTLVDKKEEKPHGPLARLYEIVKESDKKPSGS